MKFFSLLTLRPESSFLTVVELAKRWCVSASWVYHNWQALGLNPIRIGQKLRFEIQDVIDVERSLASRTASFGALSELSDETPLRVNAVVQGALSRQIKKS